jgi:hypothetical protein
MDTGIALTHLRYRRGGMRRKMVPPNRVSTLMVMKDPVWRSAMDTVNSPVHVMADVDRNRPST